MVRRKEDMINEIIAWFDFEKVQKTMSALNWEWADEGIPNLKLLKESAYERLKDAIDLALSPENKSKPDVGYFSHSGGFKATAYVDENYNLSFLQLEFIVTDWDSENI